MGEKVLDPGGKKETSVDHVSDSDFNDEELLTDDNEEIWSEDDALIPQKAVRI